MRYDEYGQVLEDTNPGFQPFGYAGGLYDPDTGLVRFGARDYDPEIGRWLAKDPVGFAGKNLNFYSYLQADPVNFIDPTGKLDIATGDGVGQARRRILDLIEDGGEIEIGEFLPMLDDEVIKEFEETRGPLTCKVNPDGSADLSNQGDPLNIRYGDGDSVDFDKKIGARLRRGKNGEVIIDKIRGIDPSGPNPGKIRLIENRACVSVLFTASCP